MRTRIAFILAAFALLPLSLAADEAIRLSEPVVATEAWEDFGAPLPEGPTRSLAEVVAEAEAMDGQDVTVATEVVQVCRKKGCFFIARDGQATARVTFRDYEFFVPTDSAGKQVVLAGTFERRAISAEQAAHYAEDLGETPPDDLEDGFEYAIVADAVRIPRG
ncbi:DUF4920 domain-containing protein [Wenzhouxiangella sp. XN79A]|uniref:DUF4920 domain-containing protein n=1 Tax=Wenzhouxiangella sp. XN79A TaxID=2724193 RepID=UPI00144AB422|nr:DUF4920 domain-containing protein [Wenzhouxiangella sp. XN79A]NKI34035.1 DUF4920 domain-containing protein [Wenzhouxiangella sp. XN79A]